MNQNNKAFEPPILTIDGIPEIDSASASDGWGMGDVLFSLNEWSFGESDF